MLQIASGKLFTNPPARENKLRGVLFSNLTIHSDSKIETAAGSLLPTSTLSGQQRQLVYELKELIEDEPSAGALVSHRIEPYIRDFAAVASFGLDATCTVSADEAARLTSPERSTNVGSIPNALVPRVFDREIVVTDEELRLFVEFVDDLIALKRKCFLDAMRAIRTYVVALHRLADDLNLSYTLFVASIESLAQSFDHVEPVWHDYEAAKREKIDQALVDADDDTARRVRDVLLETDKPALGRRFREFAKLRIKPSFFREETRGVENPISQADLDRALREAYSLRSGYIHRLRELPRVLTVAAIARGETIGADATTYFTFRGLVRLARHLILGFIRDQPKVDHEHYDYRLERHGIVQLQWASHLWLGRTDDVKLSSGVKRLEGFLDQLASHLSNEQDAVISDIRPLLAEAEKLMASGNEDNRRPFLALYILFNALNSHDQRMPNAAEIERKFSSELNVPSVEFLLVFLILRASPNWTLSDYQGIIDRYFDQRNNRNGLRLPRTFEAGILLHTAEQYRLGGEISRVKQMLCKATECHPGHEPLREVEKNFVPEQAIDWFEAVFPGSVGGDADP